MVLAPVTDASYAYCTKQSLDEMHKKELGVGSRNHSSLPPRSMFCISGQGHTLCCVPHLAPLLLPSWLPMDPLQRRMEGALDPGGFAFSGAIPDYIPLTSQELYPRLGELPTPATDFLCKEKQNHPKKSRALHLVLKYFKQEKKKRV